MNPGTDYEDHNAREPSRDYSTFPYINTGQDNSVNEAGEYINNDSSNTYSSNNTDQQQDDDSPVYHPPLEEGDGGSSKSHHVVEMDDGDEEEDEEGDKELQLNRGLGALMSRISGGGGTQRKPPSRQPAAAQVSKPVTKVQQGFDISCEGFSGWDDVNSTEKYRDYTSGSTWRIQGNIDERPVGGKRGPPPPPPNRTESTTKKPRFEYDEDVYGPQDVTDWSQVPEFGTDGDENEWLDKKYGKGVITKHGGGRTGRTGYSCKICLVELNSENTVRLHCQGMKHLKRKNIRDKELGNPDLHDEVKARQGSKRGRGGLGRDRDEWEGGRGRGGWEGERERDKWEGGRGRGGWGGERERDEWEAARGRDDWDSGRGRYKWQGGRGRDEWQGGGRARGEWEGRSGPDDRDHTRGWNRREMEDEPWRGRGGRGRGHRDWDNRVQYSDGGNNSRGGGLPNDWPPQDNWSRYSRPQDDYYKRDVEGRRPSPYGDHDRSYSKRGLTPSDRYSSEAYHKQDQYGPPPAPSLRPPTPPPAPSISEPTRTSTSTGTPAGPINLLLNKVAAVSVQTDKDADFAVEIISLFVKSLKNYNQKKGLANSVHLLEDISVRVGIMQALEKQ